jgi:hypothetical protein
MISFRPLMTGCSSGLAQSKSGTSVNVRLFNRFPLQLLPYIGPLRSRSKDGWLYGLAFVPASSSSRVKRSGDTDGGALLPGVIGSDPFRGASNLAGRSNGEPVKPRNLPPARNGFAGVLGVPSRSTLGEGQGRHPCLELRDVRTPRGRRGRHVRKEWSAKARNRSQVA